MQTFCEENKIQHWFSACYHQRGNPVERRVQELKKVLGILLTNEKVGLGEWKMKHLQRERPTKKQRKRINRKVYHRQLEF